jgi:hemerythrin
MKFTWEERMKLNVPEMDSEHMKLIEQANKLFDSLTEHTGQAETLRTLEFLEKYATEHFASEERMQRRISYPLYDEHHAIHEAFKKKVHEIVEDVRVNGITARKKLEINKLTIHWITEHIGVEDRKLADYILSKES